MKKTKNKALPPREISQEALNTVIESIKATLSDIKSDKKPRLFKKKKKSDVSLKTKKGAKKKKKEKPQKKEDIFTLLTRDHPNYFINTSPFVLNVRSHLNYIDTENPKNLLAAAILVKLSRLDKTTVYTNSIEPKEKKRGIKLRKLPKFAFLRYVRRASLSKWFRRGKLSGGLWWKRPFTKLLYRFLLKHRMYTDQPLARIFKKKFRKDIDIYTKRESLLSNKTFGSARMLSQYRIFIKRTLNNVFIHLQNIYNGEMTALNTGGTLGYKGSKKSTNVTAEKVAAATARACLFKGFKRIDVAVESPFVDKFIKTAIQGLLYVREKVKYRTKSGEIIIKKVNLSVNNILFSLAKAHNGVRKPKARRV